MTDRSPTSQPAANPLLGGEAPLTSSTTTLGGAAALSFVSTAATTAGALIRAKVVALFLGPLGVGRYAEITQLVALLNVPAGMFAGPGLVARLAEEHARGDLAAATRTRDAALSALLLASALAGLLAVGLSYYLLPSDIGPGTQPLTALAAVAAMLASWAAVVGPVFITVGKLRLMALASLFQAVLGAALTCAGVALWGLTGQFVAAAVVPLLGVPFLFWLLRLGAPQLASRPRLVLDPSFLRNASRVGGTVLIAGLAIQGTLSVVRWTLLHWGGTAQNGQFQASWAVGTVCTSVIVGSMANYAFPRFAAAPDASKLSVEMDGVVRFVLRFATPLVLVALVFRVEILQALYSREFSGAAKVLRYQLLGDIPKLVSWVYAGPLLYRGKVRAYLLTETAAALLIAGIVTGMVPILGLEGAGLAFALAYPVHSVLTHVVVMRVCHVTLKHWLTAAATGLSMVGYSLTVLQDHFPWVRWLVLLAAAGWLWRAGASSIVLARVRNKLRQHA